MAPNAVASAGKNIPRQKSGRRANIMEDAIVTPSTMTLIPEGMRRVQGDIIRLLDIAPLLQKVLSILYTLYTSNLEVVPMNLW